MKRSRKIRFTDWTCCHSQPTVSPQPRFKVTHTVVRRPPPADRLTSVPLEAHRNTTTPQHPDHSASRRPLERCLFTLRNHHCLLPFTPQKPRERLHLDSGCESFVLFAAAELVRCRCLVRQLQDRHLHHAASKSHHSRGLYRNSGLSNIPLSAVLSSTADNCQFFHSAPENRRADTLLLPSAILSLPS
jgi:hypothetical protein